MTNKVPQKAPPVKTKTPFLNAVPYVAIGAILTIVFALVIGQLFENRKQIQSPAQKQIGASTQTGNKQPSAWKTYKNVPLGFELQYPAQVKIAEELNDQYNRATTFDGDGLHFTVMLRNKGGISMDKYYFMDAPIVRKTTMGGNPANVYEFPKGYCDGPGCSDPYVAIVTVNGQNFYHISFFGDTQLSETEKQILSTFKFTN